MYGITNREAAEAQKLFLETEGIDIEPEAGIALASLIQAVEKDIVGENDFILLNITGGGRKRAEEDMEMFSLMPDASFDHNLEPESIMDELEALL